MVPNLFGTRNWFNGRQFFHKLELGGWFQDDSSPLHLLCSLFLLLLHQLHLRSSDIWSQSLETPTLKQCLLSSWMWFLFSLYKKKNVKVTQSCPTLCDPTDYTYTSLILSLHSSKLGFLCLISFLLFFSHYW